MAEGRLDGPAVEARLARLDSLLEGLESAPGPTGTSAVEAVRLLTEVYGEALARVLDRADAPLADRLADDGGEQVSWTFHPEEAISPRKIQESPPAGYTANP
ncbi:NifU family protein, partial [Streptomyces sp. NPDC005921]